MSNAPGPVSSRLWERDQRVISQALKQRYYPFAYAGGDGGWLIDADGRRYLDFSAGWAVANLGYSNQRVREAVAREMERGTFGGLLTGAHEPAVRLAERLLDIVPGPQGRKVWFGLSGSDAAEAAQRMITAATGRRRFVSFVGSWHGTHDSTMALSAHPSIGEVLAGGNVTKVPYPNPYRNPFGTGSGNVADQCLDFLENYLFATVCPPEDVAAVFVEGIQSDAGDIVPPLEFLPRLRRICDRHSILLVLDEIKVGLGRTGRMFSFQHADVTPDLVLLGKSLGGGLPVSAVVGPQAVIDAGMALFTTCGNSVGSAAALAVIEETERLGLAENSAANGVVLGDALRDALAQFELVGDVRGLGMIHGVELVDDQTAQRPNQPLAAKVVYRAWQLGLILFYAGNAGNVLEITPPLILDETEIRQGVEILRRSFEDVFDGAVTDAEVAAFAGW